MVVRKDQPLRKQELEDQAIARLGRKYMTSTANTLVRDLTLATMWSPSFAFFFSSHGCSPTRKVTTSSPRSQ